MSVVGCESLVLVAASGKQKPVGTRIVELDGLRGLAVLLVVSKHYGVRLPGEDGYGCVAFFNRVFASFSGADFFVVLMGFLFGGILLEARGSSYYYRTFFVRRALRIVPLYYFTLAVFTLAVLVQERLDMTSALDLSWPFGTPWAILGYACYLQNVCMVMYQNMGPPWLIPTWSLAVIEQFYLVLPWLVRRLPHLGLVAVLAGLFVMAPLGRYLLPTLLPSLNRHFLDCLPFCRTDTLCSGVLAAVLLRETGFRNRLVRCRWLLWPLAAALFGGFAVLIFSGHRFGSTVMHVITHSYLAVFYLVVILGAVFSAQGMVGKLLRWEAMRCLGRISYGIFLFHQPVNGLLNGLVFSGLHSQDNAWDALLVSADAFLITAGLATLSWHFVEKPLIEWGKAFRYQPAGRQLRFDQRATDSGVDTSRFQAAIINTGD